MIIEIILTIVCSLLFSYLFFKLYIIVTRKRQQKQMIAKIKAQKEKGYKFIVPKMNSKGEDVGEEIDLVTLIDAQLNQLNPSRMIVNNNKPVNQKVILQNIDEDDI